MEAKCWILVGMMGAGKTSVGRELAERSERPFLDTDHMLQNRFGRTVARIFEIYGEDAFREHETSVLRSLEPQAAVLSTGGGIVTREANWVEMRRLGTTIFLDASFETLKERLEASKKRRPLLEVENWQERLSALLESRLPLYRQADLIVSLDDYGVEGAAEYLLERLQS